MPTNNLSPQREYQELYAQAYHQLVVMNGLMSLFCQFILAQNNAQGCAGITEQQVAALRYQYQQLEQQVGEALDFAQSHLS